MNCVRASVSICVCVCVCVCVRVRVAFRGLCSLLMEGSDRMSFIRLIMKEKLVFVYKLFYTCCVLKDTKAVAVYC